MFFYEILVFECSATSIPENGEDNRSTTVETFTRVSTITFKFCGFGGLGLGLGFCPNETSSKISIFEVCINHLKIFHSVSHSRAIYIITGWPALLEPPGNGFHSWKTSWEI